MFDGQFYAYLNGGTLSSNLTLTSMTANGYDFSDTLCTSALQSDVQVGNLVIIAGSTFGLSTASSTPITTSKVTVGSTVTINGVSRSDGGTFTVGSTTVTLSVQTCDFCAA